MSLFDSVERVLDQGINLIRDREIRLGVTGLSRGGKTALITSLVNNICSFGLQDTALRLPLFREYSEHGISWGGIARSNNFSVSQFPYYEMMQKLEQETPEWPKSTDGICEIRLEIRSRNDRWYVTGNDQRIFLDIWDYPGEWLMDLMLLDMDYEEFSEKAKIRFATVETVCDASEFKQLAMSINGADPMSEPIIKKAVELYTDWLHRCKDRGFALLVPGRFLLPGELKGAPLLEFIPWLSEIPEHYSDNSVYGVLKERYNAYKEKVVRRFYRECFSKLDRQVIIVDGLKALRGGRETFMDINDSFDVLLKHFNYGSGNFLTRLFSPKIDKVMFAASKADQITNDQHKNLLALLRSMVTQASQSVRSGGAAAEFMTLSSIRSTNCKRYQKGDIDTEVLVTDYPDDKPYYPGSIPSKWSRESMMFFQENFDFRNLRPPKIEPGGVLPSINLDVLLHYILGDKL